MLLFFEECNCINLGVQIDDGISGTTFDRPDFNRMIKDIEQGKINMVVTKDMSRLGRDYVNFGHYIEKYFPENNVRYIAINDNVDTAIDTIGNDIIPFKAIFNDMYAKDISKKVKASINAKKKQGLFLGAFPPYGYIRDPENKYKLLLDPVASVIVKRIYKMFLDGNSVNKISETFTAEKITRPSIHLKLKVNSSKTKNIWDARTVWDILKNPNYTGNLYQNRRKKVNYKSKKIINAPEKDWIIAYDTHEPIVDITTFELVQNIHEKNKLTHTRNDYNKLLKGFIHCKECGHTIGIQAIKDRGKTYYYTVCNHYRKHSKRNFCTRHSMRYENLENVIFKEIKSMCKKFINTEKLKDIMKNSNKKTKVIEGITNRISQAKKTIENNTNHIQNCYYDKLNGIITLEIYQHIAEQLAENISINQKLIAELEKEKQSLTDNTIYDDKTFEKIIKDYLLLKEPNRALLANIVDKIVIDENKNIDIHYKIKPIGL